MDALGREQTLRRKLPLLVEPEETIDELALRRPAWTNQELKTWRTLYRTSGYG
jgi:hypothetical protein